jgi:hypothetical protein
MPGERPPPNMPPSGGAAVLFTTSVRMSGNPSMSKSPIRKGIRAGFPELVDLGSAKRIEVVPGNRSETGIEVNDFKGNMD